MFFSFLFFSFFPAVHLRWINGFYTLLHLASTAGLSTRNEVDNAGVLDCVSAHAQNCCQQNWGRHSSLWAGPEAPHTQCSAYFAELGFPEVGGWWRKHIASNLLLYCIAFTVMGLLPDHLWQYSALSCCMFSPVSSENTIIIENTRQQRLLNCGWSRGTVSSPAEGHTWCDQHQRPPLGDATGKLFPFWFC